MKKVVITGTVGTMPEPKFRQFSELIRKKYGKDVDIQFLFDEGTVDDDRLIAAVKGANIIVDQFQPLSERFYEECVPAGLEAYVAHGIGYNSANLEVATDHGVYVCNVPNYCMEEVAFHAITLMLASARRLNVLIDWVNTGHWGGGFKCMEPVRRFSRCTVGLYGFGRIAKHVASMLAGFGCKIIAYDPFLPDEVVRANGAEPVSFEELCAQADFISTHVPLIPGTEGAFDKKAFQMMKPTTVFVNTARGALCVLDDLYEALTTGEIAFAAIDAYVTEPPSGIEAKIKALPNVISTPHVGYYSLDSMEDFYDQMTDVVVNLLNDTDPGSIINRDLWNKKHGI